jgi:hypothetical protein
VRYDDFDRLVKRLARELPPEFLGGVEGLEVSRKTVPHPSRADVYTLGECIPLPTEDQAGPAGVQSRVVLYHGSFQALASLDEDFDWRAEVWETLTHEIRHHLEWRARAPDLEAFDWAADQNFARAEGEPFDPLFYQSGERVEEGVYRIDDDFFLEHVVREVPTEVRFDWHGRSYRGTTPPGATLPGLLIVEGVAEPPPGELVLVLQRKPGLRSLFTRTVPWQGQLVAELV